jgi:diguanylate cyclase (GGDEF)-like protein
VMQGEMAPLTLEADAPLVQAAFRAVIADPNSHPVVVYRRHAASGEIRWAETTMSNLLDDSIIAGIVLNVRDVTEREEARLALQESEERYRSLAQHDLLTGLPNRRVFLERLAVSLDELRPGGSRRRTAVLFIDLDAFKDVNDTHGHEAGDALLCEVATRLASAVRGRDTVARYGGDEFTVMSSDCGSDAEVVRFAQRLLELVRRPVVFGQHDIICGASIGIAVGPPGTASELMKRADAAMYRAKSAGGGAVELDRDLRDSSMPA